MGSRERLQRARGSPARGQGLSGGNSPAGAATSMGTNNHHGRCIPRPGKQSNSKGCSRCAQNYRCFHGQFAIVLQINLTSILLCICLSTNIISLIILFSDPYILYRQMNAGIMGWRSICHSRNSRQIKQSRATKRQTTQAKPPQRKPRPSAHPRRNRLNEFKFGFGCACPYGDVSLSTIPRDSTWSESCKSSSRKRPCGNPWHWMAMQSRFFQIGGGV